MYIVAVFAVFIFWFVLDYIKWRTKFFIPLEKIPALKRYPVIGTFYIFIGVPQERLFQHYENHVKSMPPLFLSWRSAAPIVHFRKAEHLEMIMNNSIHITKGNSYDYLRPWLGEGLLTSTGERWREHRKLLTPTFHFKILETFMEVFADRSKHLLSVLEKENRGDFFDIFPHLNTCALDIICETAMGINSAVMRTNNAEYVNSIKRMCTTIVWRISRPYIGDTLFYLLPQGRRHQTYKKNIHDFSYKVIMERKQLLQQTKITTINKHDSNKNKRLSFLDLLLEVSENGSVLSDKVIRDQVDTFMFEGHDTVTASLSWSIFLLGNYPDVQEKVFLEVQAVLGDKNTPTTLQELNQMKYLECVIKEALRLYPSVPLVTRIAAKDLLVDGYHIPRDTELVLNIYQIHRDQEYYPEPEKFDPDRFLPENSEKRHPFSYLAFSAGSRNCIGQRFALYEEKTILASIVKNFSVRSRETQEEINFTGNLILRPLKGIDVALKKRHS